jgi:hypothetical protein
MIRRPPQHEEAMKADINNRFVQTFMPLAKLVGKITASKDTHPGILMNLQQRKLLTPHLFRVQEWK